MPKIGLNASFLQSDNKGWAVTVKSAYPDAILRAGGTPIILPPMEDIAKLRDAVAEMDAILLIGGGDIRAERFGAEQSPLADLVHERRENFDFALAAVTLALAKPVLGICLGCQVLNVLYGGTLYQDLPTEFIHEDDCSEKNVQHSNALHAVNIKPDTLLAQILGTGSLDVNSRHHQATRDVGCGLVVSARSKDGLVEGIEDPSRPFVLGVQWHPEDLIDIPVHLNLFTHFIEAARKTPRGK